MKRWNGAIIEESLEDKELLREVSILKKRTVFNIFAARKQPKMWHIYDVAVADDKIKLVCEKAKKSLKSYGWYIDFGNNAEEIVLFRGKMFRVRKNDREGIRKIKEYGKAVGAPERQLDFDKHW